MSAPTMTPRQFGHTRSEAELRALWMLENAVCCAHARGEDPQRSAGVRAAEAALVEAIEARELA